MKRLLFGLLLLIVSMGVVSATSLSSSATTLDYDILAGDSDSDTITLTAVDGNVRVTGITFVSEDGDTNVIEDDDGDEIDVSFSATSATISSGSSASVSVTVDADDSVDEDGDYEGTITITAIDADTGTPLTDTTVAVTIDVTPDICEEGIQGRDLDISVDNPDSGDEFAPGDTVNIEVDVQNDGNDDLDVDIEAILYNNDEGDREESVKTSGSIDEDEEESFSLELELPTSLDDADDYSIFIQVHEEGNEDDNCNYEEISIDLERDDEDVRITETSATPSFGLVAGDDYRVSITVESSGTDDMQDLYIELRDSDLDVSETTDPFDVGDYNDEDSDFKASFDLIVPQGVLAGTYYIEAIVYNDNGVSLDSELIEVTIEETDEDGSSSAAARELGDLTMTLGDEYTVDGSELTISVVLENTGDEEKTITLGAEDVSWAHLDSTDVLTTLAPGDKVHGYLYFTLDTTTEGEHDISITVTDQDGDTLSKIVTVDFGEPVVEEEDAFFSGVSDWFKEKSENSQTFWVLVDIVLVILGLVFLRMLLNKR